MIYVFGWIYAEERMKKISFKILPEGLDKFNCLYALKHKDLDVAVVYVNTVTGMIEYV